MKRVQLRPARWLAAALLAGLACGAVAAELPSPPPFYAIRDARVVTGTGETLERATVLIADGVIEAIGTDLAIPADAWVVEAEGMTLYPGLIDAMSVLGLSSGPGDGNGPPRRGDDSPPVRGPEDRPKTTPWASPADDLRVDDTVFERWRDAGFTAAVISPKDGIFPGEATVVALGHGEPRDLVVATPVAQRVTFEGGSWRDFPGSLMGVLSYVKQTLSDAQHYARAHELFEDSPRGRQRPDYDRTLAPIHEAMADGRPFLMPADSAPEIGRALAIADEYDLATVIYGAQGAWAVIDEIEDEDAAVLVTLDWPEEDKNADPDADPDFRELAHRRLAPTTPRRLWEEGVPFALVSGGEGNAGDAMAGVRTAIEAGLPPEAALEALTLGPARIFGVDDRLGSIEVGKAANLVLASAEPWAEDAEIAAVFVDGHKFEKLEAAEEFDPPTVDVTGSWELELETPGGVREVTADLEQADDGKVTGEISGERGTSTVEDGRVSGSTLTFKVVQSRGGQSMEASYTAQIEGEALEGTLSAGPMQMEIAGTRASSSEEATVADGEGDESEVSEEELLEGLRLFQGPVETGDSFAITNATVWTLTAAEPLENATVVVENGKIAAVGPSVGIPSGVEVIDAEGGHVIPGIIDAHSHIAIDGGVNEGSLAVTAMVSIGDVIDPDDIAIYRALAGGVTAANLLHGSANPIGGQNAVIKLRWGADAEGLVFEEAPPGIKFALGENPKRSRSFPGSQQRYPATRMGVMDVIRDAFAEARQYQKDWQQYDAAVARGERPIPPRRDLELEALVEILDGERLVHSHCYRADEILQLLRLAEEFDVQIATLQHVLEGYKVADEIAAHGAGASTFSDWWGYKVEAYDAIPYNAALMHERGVLVSINSDSAEEMRHLNHEAAKAVHWGGVSEVEALKMVTLNPAKQLRVDDRVGTIEVGKDADLVLYDGHPLSVYSVVQKTFVDGDLYFDLDVDRERQAKLEELEARMLGKDENGAEEATDEMPPTAVTPDTTPITAPPDWVTRAYGSAEGSYSCKEVH